MYSICGRQALVPRSLAFPLCYDPKEDPLYHGGFADVWKGQHLGRDVAVKVLRLYPKDDLTRTRNVGCLRDLLFVIYINERSYFVEILQEGYWMESPPSSKCAAVVRCDDD